ncbi:MAG TPA: hypothetical protein VJY62_02200 [Bacteroidia bacterium]|nr:hypothetical protein [Bacteroidia bacterium]
MQVNKGYHYNYQENKYDAKHGFTHKIKAIITKLTSVKAKSNHELEISSIWKETGGE